MARLWGPPVSSHFELGVSGQLTWDFSSFQAAVISKGQKYTYPKTKAPGGLAGLSLLHSLLENLLQEQETKRDNFVLLFHCFLFTESFKLKLEFSFNVSASAACSSSGLSTALLSTPGRVCEVPFLTASHQTRE